MANDADERTALHRENVRVKAHLDALADFASAGRNRRKKTSAEFTLPAGPELDFPADPRMSTTPTLMPRPFAPAPVPAAPAAAVGMSSPEMFFGDFEAEPPATPVPPAPVKSAASFPSIPDVRPISRADGDDFFPASDVYIPSEGGPVVFISPDDGPDGPSPFDGHPGLDSHAGLDSTSVGFSPTAADVAAARFADNPPPAPPPADDPAAPTPHKPEAIHDVLDDFNW